MNYRIAEIGIALIALGFTIVPFLWMRYMGGLFWSWYMSFQISTLTLSLLRTSSSLVLAIAGLALYIAGRRQFWMIHRKQSVRMLLTILGTVLITLGGMWSFQYIAVYFRFLIHYFPDATVGILALISGIMFLTDNLRAGNSAPERTTSQSKLSGLKSNIFALVLAILVILDIFFLAAVLAMVFRPH